MLVAENLVLGNNSSSGYVIKEATSTVHVYPKSQVIVKAAYGSYSPYVSIFGKILKIDFSKKKNRFSRPLTVLCFFSESYVVNAVVPAEDQPMNVKNYAEEREATPMDEVLVKPESSENADSEFENYKCEMAVTEEQIKQNDIIKEAGSVILSTCYENSVPGEAVVEAYEETVNCVSPSSFANVSDAEGSQADSDREDATVTNEQAPVVEDGLEQPPLKKSKLWEEREAM